MLTSFLMALAAIILVSKLTLLSVGLPRMSNFWKANVNWVLFPVRAAGWIACCAGVRVTGESRQALPRSVLHKCLSLVGICSLKLKMFSLISGNFPSKCPWHFSQGTIIVFTAICSHTENAVINYSTVPGCLRVCLLGWMFGHRFREKAAHQSRALA